MKWKNLDANSVAPHFINVVRVRSTTDGTVILDLGYLDPENSNDAESIPVLIKKVVMPKNLYDKMKESIDPPTKVWFN
jgi:hypothetical protein